MVTPYGNLTQEVLDMAYVNIKCLEHFANWWNLIHESLQITSVFLGAELPGMQRLFTYSDELDAVGKKKQAKADKHYKITRMFLDTVLTMISFAAMIPSGGTSVALMMAAFGVQMSVDGILDHNYEHGNFHTRWINGTVGEMAEHLVARSDFAVDDPTSEAARDAKRILEIFGQTTGGANGTVVIDKKSLYSMMASENRGFK
jgi:hypothetical protein